MIIDVQDVFDKVIQTACYANVRHYQFMCFTLTKALNEEIITMPECATADEAIKDYLGGSFGSLQQYLNYHSLPQTFEDRLKIYSNWRERLVRN